MYSTLDLYLESDEVPLRPLSCDQRGCADGKAQPRSYLRVSGYLFLRLACSDLLMLPSPASTTCMG